MFYVYDKETGEKKEVLAVNYIGCTSEAMFLFWENKQWVWRSSSFYEKD